MTKKVNTDLNNYIKSKVDDSTYLRFEKNISVDLLVDAIKSGTVLHVNGAFGTGKGYLVNEILVPELKKNYELSQINFSEENLLSVNDSIFEIERLNKERLIIVSSKYLIKSNKQTDDSPLIIRLKHLADSGYNIKLNDIQDQFLELPYIIESFAMKRYSISIDKIEVVMVGYLEMIITGLKNNMTEIENYIKADDLKAWKEELPLYFKDKVYILTFNNFIKSNQIRNNLWASFWDKPQTINLSEIAAFNKKFQKTWKNIAGDVALGVRKKHPKIKVLEKIMAYCRALLGSIGIEINTDIDKKIFEPITKYINQLKSGKYIINSSIESVYFFKKLLVKPNIDFSKLPMIYFDTLKITRDDDDKYRLQTYFQLIGESVETPKIRLTTREASFLIYLAMERQRDSGNWLLNPTKFRNIIDLIVSKLELRSDVDFGEQNREIAFTWLNDPRNDIRRKIVNDIKSSIKNECGVNYRIFQSIDIDSHYKGVYRLIKSITHIKLPW